MQGKGLVFVTGDRLGDQLTALLEEAGCQMVRGPQPWQQRMCYECCGENRRCM